MHTATAIRTVRPSGRLRVVAPHVPKVGLLLSAAVGQLDAAWEAVGPATWAVEIRTTHQRSQVVLLRHDQLTDRIEFTSTVGPYRSSLGTTELLRHTSELPLGRVCVDESSSGQRLFIRHEQPRTANVNDITNAISLIGWAADALELELFARDVE
jgi:hypothetical protein